MALRIVIDGNNLICVEEGEFFDMDDARSSLAERLAAYKRLKRARVTVVFDGKGSIGLQRTKELRRGVELIYSRAGEEADSVIKEMARALGPGITVVTSDRELASYAEGKGSVVIDSAEFSGLLHMAAYEELKGLEPGDEEPPNPGGAKKGPAYKPSKKERQKRQRLKKL